MKNPPGSPGLLYSMPDNASDTSVLLEKSDSCCTELSYHTAAIDNDGRECEHILYCIGFRPGPKQVVHL